MAIHLEEHASLRRAAEPLRPIPLLFLVTNFDRGGAEKIVARLAAGLPRDKYAVRVAALQGRSWAIGDDLAKVSIPAHDMGMACKWDPRVVLRLAHLLRRQRIQILFTFIFHPTLLGRVVGWVCGVPIRVSSERVMAWEGPARRLLNRWTAPLSTHIVAVSERVAVYAAREFRIPSERLSTIPNGVDLDHFRPTRRPGDGTRFVIGCTARLHKKNDHATLLRAFATVAARSPQAKLLLVGRGPEEAHLKALADELGIASRASFVGEQPDVAPYLLQMDLYVQSSVAEGMPNSVLEAMATGLPVVATAVGGTPDAVIDNETGLLVPPGDPSALADAVLRLLSDQRLAESFGRAGRARAEAHLDERLMLRRMEHLLDRVVEHRLKLIFKPTEGWVAC